MLEQGLSKILGVDARQFVEACKLAIGKAIQNLARDASGSVLACLTRQAVVLVVALARRDMLKGAHVASVSDADILSAFGITNRNDRLELALAEHGGDLTKEEKEELRAELKEKEEARAERHEKVWKSCF